MPEMNLQLWPGWRIVRKLGSGSYGDVYEIHRQEGRFLERAALKVIRIPSDQKELLQLRAEGLPAESTEEYYYRQVESIRSEIDIMQQFVGYSNIVSYEDHSIQRRPEEFGWDVLIRMELLTPLSDYMSRHTLTEKEVLRLGIDISQALMICHGAGIIHRDIKPQNIFINALGFYKLGDFGISRALPRSSSELSFKGSIAYMAPETFSMRNTDMRSDIYSLALVLYRCLNGGREPFLPSEGGFSQQERDMAQNRRMNGEPFPRPGRGSNALCRVIARALSYDPDMRFQTAGQFRDALLQVDGSVVTGRKLGGYPSDGAAGRIGSAMSAGQDRNGQEGSPDHGSVQTSTEQEGNNSSDPETTTELKKNKPETEPPAPTFMKPPEPEPRIPEISKEKETEPPAGPVPMEPGRKKKAPAIRQSSLEPAGDLGAASGNNAYAAAGKESSEEAERAETDHTAKKEAVSEKGGKTISESVSAPDYRGRTVPENSPVSEKQRMAVSDGKPRKSQTYGDKGWTIAVIPICLAACAAVFLFYSAAGKTADVTQKAAVNLSAISVHASEGTCLRLAGMGADVVSTLDDVEVTFRDPVLGEAVQSALQITDNEITITDLRDVRELTLKIAEDDQDGGITGLEDLLLFPALESLTMRGCGLTDEIDFSVLQKLSELNYLDLHRNEITDLTAFQELEKLSYLDLSKNKIADVSPLNGLADLESLALYNNTIENIEPLASLTALRELYLDENKITDISPLRGMVNLQYLRLDDNKVEEVTPLQPLTRLESLDLENNRITDITPLGTLTSLTELWIGKNQIKQIKSLQNMEKLQYVSFKGNKVSDLAPLQKMTQLREMAFSDNAVTDISPLKKLTSLTYLEADNNKITDLSPLKEMGKLETLYLNRNEITDLSSLKKLSELKILALGGNKIEDISPLKELTALESLDLYTNQIKDISGLSKLTKLTWLNIGHNQISDLSPLKNMKALETLQAYHNQVKDLASLKDLAALRFIELDSNSIKDVSALKKLDKLERLYIEYNQVTDVSPLQNLSGLKMIYLAGNNISDYSSLDKLKDAGTKIFKESQYE